jgi:hypothetical protein
MGRRTPGPTKLYAYGFAHGPSVFGYAFEIRKSNVVKYLVTGRLTDECVEEVAVDHGRLRPIGEGRYEIQFPDGFTYVLVFDGGRVIAHWTSGTGAQFEDLMATTAPDLGELKREWEAMTGVSAEDFQEIK